VPGLFTLDGVWFRQKGLASLTSGCHGCASQWQAARHQDFSPTYWY
jgi:hypothetical protein